MDISQPDIEQMTDNTEPEKQSDSAANVPCSGVVRCRIVRLPLSTTNRPVDVIKHWRDEGYLNMNTPYQRGDVWGPIRQRNLIRSILSGIPVPSIIVNVRDWGDDYSISVIDGKQRMTAVLAFCDSKLSVPAEWFGRHFGDLYFKDLDKVDQRRFRNQTMGFAEGALTDIEAEKEVFELVNFGGVPQGESDI